MKRMRPRQGFLYLAVLFTSLIVIASATAAFSISTNRLRSRQATLDSSDALRTAEAEAHRMASLLSTADLSWRSTLSNDVVSSWRSGDGGALLCSKLNDTDGNLADDSADPVTVTCYSALRQARRGVSFSLRPIAKPLSILDYGLVSSGAIALTSPATFASTGRVLSGSNIVVGPNVIASAAAWNATSAISSTARGVKTVTGQSVSIPGSTITSKYTELATPIAVASLPQSGGALLLRRRILTSTVNPFGTVNADGIYWINAGGLPVTISECRVRATLVITNSSLVTLTAANHLTSPSSGAAVLVTTAPIRVTQCARLLIESSTSTNFNPTSMPYRGVGDSDTADRYQSVLEGLVYTPGLFEWASDNAINGMWIHGTIVCGNATISGPISIEADRDSYTNPPLGFRLYDTMQFVRGSWRTVPVPTL
jgi:hypothetical protein